MTTEEQEILERRLETAKQIQQSLEDVGAYLGLAADNTNSVRITISQTIIQGIGIAPDCVRHAVRNWLEQCRSDLVAEYEQL